MSQKNYQNQYIDKYNQFTSKGDAFFDDKLETDECENLIDKRYTKQENIVETNPECGMFSSIGNGCNDTLNSSSDSIGTCISFKPELRKGKFVKELFKLLFIGSSNLMVLFLRLLCLVAYLELYDVSVTLLTQISLKCSEIPAIFRSCEVLEPMYKVSFDYLSHGWWARFMNQSFAEVILYIGVFLPQMLIQMFLGLMVIKRVIWNEYYCISVVLSSMFEQLQSDIKKYKKKQEKKRTSKKNR